jgi:hypothetical protein
MSETETQVENILTQLTELIPEIEDQLEQLKIMIVENSDDEEVIETAEEIWDIIDQAENVLETIDFEELPDTINIEELPEAIDMEKVPEAIADGDAREAIDLSALKDGLELRELWEAVDLTELRRQKQELDDEVEDVTGEEGDEDGDGLLDMDGMMGMGGGAHMQFDIEDLQEKIQEMITKAVKKFRAMLIETHDKVRLLWEFNQQKMGGKESLNPTAVRTMPKGPLPDSASTRVSTVPSQVKYSRAKNPRRIYGRRFNNANTEQHDNE